MASRKDVKDLNVVGINLRKARIKAGLSQEGLAHLAEVSQVAVSGIETGARNPSLAMLAKLSDALEIQVRDLFRKAG